MRFTQYIFPFDEVEQGSKIIIYGAGEVGRQFVDQITSLNYCSCLFVVDKNFLEIQKLNGIDICDPNRISKCIFDKVVVASTKFKEDINEKLINMGVPARKIVNKQIKVVYDKQAKFFTPDPHNSDYWDLYYNNAEKAATHQFDSYFKPFLERYKDISLSKVLDFACGWGRMANQFAGISKNITCCDINATAINFCKERFSNTSGCSFEFLVTKNDNGLLNPIPVENGSFTFIYSWDAMVHFSYKWLDFYIKDFYRILSDDSYAVIHHSNLGATTGDDTSHNWYEQPHGRSPISHRDVTFMAQNHGFAVIEQRIIDWGEPNIDCISVLKK